MAFSNFNSRIARLFLDAGMQDVDGSETLFYNGANGQQLELPETTMNLGWSAKNNTVRGSRRVRFTKMALATMFRNVTPVVYAYTPRSTKEVAEALIKRYGLPLDADWFVNTPIPTEVGNSPDFTIGISLKRTLFTRNPSESEGATQVRVIQADVDLSEIFKNNVLSTPVMPFVVRMGYTNLETLTYGIDFTPDTPERFILLRDIQASIDLYGFESPSAERSGNLVELLSDRTGRPATVEADQDGKICLLRATLVYNGPTVGFPTADTWYDNVLVFDSIVDPIDSAARDYRGRAYVHYNNII